MHNTEIINCKDNPRKKYDMIVITGKIDVRKIRLSPKRFQRLVD